MKYEFKVVQNENEKEFIVHSFNHLEQLMHEWYEEENGDELQEHVDDFGNLYGYTVHK
ncbi:hypothetical protein [Paenibacillus glucanolyticus]|uniref:hypothetical protein n=1 Tax=Paenibacillus glucanolyticus TaxID=59843 RepID=UPI0015C31244|nr:hypothetical protein [Paenibacillus glucanolyticus]